MGKKDNEMQKKNMEFKQDNPAKSAPIQRSKKERKNNRKKESKKGKIFGYILVVIQGVLSGFAIEMLLQIGILPMKYMAAVVGVLLLLFLFTLFTQKRHKGRAIWGKLLSILLILVLGAGSFYMKEINDAFDMVTDGSYKIDCMVVAVLREDPAETVQDAKYYDFGVQYALGGKDIKEAMDIIHEELAFPFKTVEYESVEDQAEALMNGNVEAIIYNEGYTGLLEEAIPGYAGRIKTIYSYEIKKEMEFTSQAIDVTKEMFSIYISEIEGEGLASKNSQSDVNIVLTVNPRTRQILQITVPRDYYVVIPEVSNGVKDKLACAGIYGVDASIAALGHLYETKIPFYVRANFTSIKEGISPQMLVQPNGIANYISGNVETNLTKGQIQALMKMQLDQGDSWKVHSVTATGTVDSNATYSMPNKSAYVMIPDQSSVDKIINKMNRVKSGETLEGIELVQ